MRDDDEMEPSNVQSQDFRGPWNTNGKTAHWKTILLQSNEVYLGHGHLEHGGERMPEVEEWDGIDDLGGALLGEKDTIDGHGGVFGCMEQWLEVGLVCDGHVGCLSGRGLVFS